MFAFKLEADRSLLTVTRTGVWTLGTVNAYAAALRRELAKLRLSGGPTSFIIDVRLSGKQPPEVAEALRTMVAGLGPLHADRVAIVASSGLSKLEARRGAEDNAAVFPSMILARDWATGKSASAPISQIAHNAPGNVEAKGALVQIQVQSGVEVFFTPAAALETAKRIVAVAGRIQRKLAAALPSTSESSAYTGSNTGEV